MPFLMMIFLKNRVSNLLLVQKELCGVCQAQTGDATNLQGKEEKELAVPNLCPTLHGPRSYIPRLHVPFDSATWLRWLPVKRCLWLLSEHRL